MLLGVDSQIVRRLVYVVQDTSPDVVTRACALAVEAGLAGVAVRGVDALSIARAQLLDLPVQFMCIVGEEGSSRLHAHEYWVSESAFRKKKISRFYGMTVGMDWVDAPNLDAHVGRLRSLADGRLSCLQLFVAPPASWPSDDEVVAYTVQLVKIAALYGDCGTRVLCRSDPRLVTRLARNTRVGQIAVTDPKKVLGL